MGSSLVVQAVAAIAAIAVYFLPSIIADRRKRHDVLMIALFNACVGWTVLGWLLALYWAWLPNPPRNLAGDIVEKRRIVRMRNFSKSLLDHVNARVKRSRPPE